MEIIKWVRGAAARVVSATKKSVGMVLGFIAKNGERFVEDVKDTWRRVAPILRDHVKPFLDKLENWVPPNSWIGTAVVYIKKGMEALLALENSPVLKLIEKAILWAIDKAKKYRDFFLSEEEMDEVWKQREDLHDVTSGFNNEDQRKAFSLAEMVHDIVLARSAIKHIFDKNDVKDLDLYLRLRATQKLLDGAQKSIDRALSVDEISLDDIFLLRVAANLISDKPTLVDADAERLDRIVERKFGKSLLAFVFEEMVMAWSSSLSTAEEEWAVQNKAFSKDRTILRRLEQTVKLGGELDSEESTLLSELRESVPRSERILNDTADLILAKKKYIYASEGLLQVLEKPEEYFAQKEQEYLADGAKKVGGLIVNLSQENRAWSSLSKEEQSLINDYANIFAADSKARAAKLVEVEV